MKFSKKIKPTFGLLSLALCLYACDPQYKLTLEVKNDCNTTLYFIYDAEFNNSAVNWDTVRIGKGNTLSVFENYSLGNANDAACKMNYDSVYVVTRDGSLEYIHSPKDESLWQSEISEDKNRKKCVLTIGEKDLRSRTK